MEHEIKIVRKLDILLVLAVLTLAFVVLAYLRIQSPAGKFIGVGTGGQTGPPWTEPIESTTSIFTPPTPPPGSSCGVGILSDFACVPNSWDCVTQNSADCPEGFKCGRNCGEPAQPVCECCLECASGEVGSVIEPCASEGMVCCTIPPGVDANTIALCAEELPPQIDPGYVDLRFCGDGNCDPEENRDTCPRDCGEIPIPV